MKHMDDVAVHSSGKARAKKKKRKGYRVQTADSQNVEANQLHDG